MSQEILMEEIDFLQNMPLTPLGLSPKFSVSRANLCAKSPIRDILQDSVNYGLRNCSRLSLQSVSIEQEDHDSLYQSSIEKEEIEQNKMEAMEFQ